MTASLYAGVAIAGSIGAVARFTLDGAINTRRPSTFPFGTLVINVSGSLLLGILTGAVLYLGAPDSLRVVLGTGFCGGFTTFSTASVEVVRLAQRHRSSLAAANAIGTLLLCLLAAGAGLAITAV